MENAIQHTQNTALKGRKFESIEAQNGFLTHWEQRWASKRIHGRMKRQVEEMFQEEKPYLKQLPLESFKYFEQGVRTVCDDGAVQIGHSYYSALPAKLYAKVLVRIYDKEIEIIDPATMETIRRHMKSNRPGSFEMEEEDRIYNPSRQTHSLFARASEIGPETRKLCELLFARQGRAGQRKMQGIVNLARHYEVRHIEQACRMAVEVDLSSYRSIANLVRHKAEKANDENEPAGDVITQAHRLIRPGSDYGQFWNQHACRNQPSTQPAGINRKNLPQIRRSADWNAVIDVFDLQVAQDRRHKPDEIWIRSPFTNERTASLYVNLTQNVFKDFSSGKGGGILTFCQDLLAARGRSMNCYQVADWMIKNGISEPTRHMNQRPRDEEKKKRRRNRPIKADLRRWLLLGHPALVDRGISPSTCRYLGCGFLPQKPDATPGSPLNGRLVFQVRAVVGKSVGFKPVILSHVGRALSPEQEQKQGKYWGFPFFKGLEIYNQDNLLLDANAKCQIKQHGLILVEGFFDVAKLVEAGLLNVGALMGAYISGEQIDRLKFIHDHVPIPHINLFLDRDETGMSGADTAAGQLETSGFRVRIFDWNQSFEKPDGTKTAIADTIKDAGDMSVRQLNWLREQGKL